MAKITDFQAITLSSLSNEDVFHMVDLSGDSIIGSRKLSYEVLKQGIDRDIEKVQVIKGCSYNKETKTIELSVGLSDGGTKVLSISMEELNIYHAEDGLSTKVGDDNTFVVDWTKVSQVGHKHLESDITDFGSYLSSSESFLSVNALDGISSDWTYEHSKNTLSNEGYEVISRLGTLAYKNEISASEVCGYEDTKYTAGEGLKLEGTEFSISTDYIKRTETDGKLALCSFSDLNLKELAHKDESDISSHYLPSGNSYLTSNALDNLSGKWQVTYETVSCLSGNWNTAWSRVSAASCGLSDDIGSIGYKNSLSTSDILGYEDTKYSNGFGLSVRGTEFGVDTDKIALKEHKHTSEDITNISNYTLKTEVSSYECDPKFNKWLSSAPVKIGLMTTASGPNSIAIGIESQATGRSSIAIGHYARVGAEHAVQLGHCLTANDIPNSFRFRDTYIVKNGVIPNKSLELCSVNGILSSDGKGSIIGTEEYVHPTYINKELGLYKISVDNGHVGGVVSVSKEDITSLGIPGQDTSCYVEDGHGLKISNNVISIDYSELCSEIDLTAYSKTDTKYYAGRGLSIDTTTNTFSTSADFVTYVYVVQHLSNEGYYATFRDWGFKG